MKTKNSRPRGGGKVGLTLRILWEDCFAMERGDEPTIAFMESICTAGPQKKGREVVPTDETATGGKQRRTFGDTREKREKGVERGHTVTNKGKKVVVPTRHYRQEKKSSIGAASVQREKGRIWCINTTYSKTKERGRG